MAETKSLVRRVGLPAGFGVRLRVAPSQVRACFEDESDVTVYEDRLPADAPRRWFIARALPGHGISLRIAPERTSQPVFGGIGRPLHVEARLRVVEDGDGSRVEVSHRLVPSIGLAAALVYPGIGLFIAGWLLGGALGVVLAAFMLSVMVWPRNLAEEARDLRNKVSAALGPVLAEDEDGGVYR